MNQLEGSGPPPASKEQMDKLYSTQITQPQVGENYCLNTAHRRIEAKREREREKREREIGEEG